MAAKGQMLMRSFCGRNLATGRRSGVLSCWGKDGDSSSFVAVWRQRFESNDLYMRVLIIEIAIQ